jgi:hypothetical protein
VSAGSGLGGLLLPDEFALDHDLDLIADDELAIAHHVKRQAAVLPVDPSGGAAAQAPGPSGRRQADLGVWSVEDALAALRGGEAVMVDVGVAGQRSFINTSSTGVSVDLIIALVRVLRCGRPYELILNGHHRRLWLYFAGSCRYEPAGTAPAYRPNPVRRVSRHPRRRRRAAGQVTPCRRRRHQDARLVLRLPHLAGQGG